VDNMYIRKPRGTAGVPPQFKGLTGEGQRNETGHKHLNKIVHDISHMSEGSLHRRVLVFVWDWNMSIECAPLSLPARGSFAWFCGALVDDKWGGRL
jgi:hypothetical protein